jgi:pimeloyl-ACP methyl ester carboxylesterase
MSMTHSHHTAPTQYVEAAGIRFAYRRFGKPGAAPLVLNMHFTGTIDHWDPLVTDGLAAGREVILFDNAGVAGTSGSVPATAEVMAANAAAFIKALGLTQVDVLGFSMGGFVAQALTEAEPDLVRRLVLVGTGPRGGEAMGSLTPEAQAVFGKTYAQPDDLWLGVFFTPSEQSQAAGRAFLQRPADGFGYLRAIPQPTLVINGTHDVIVYTVNSLLLAQNLPNAQLILYPDANHGAQYQYPDVFVADVTRFLDAATPFPIPKAA